MALFNDKLCPRCGRQYDYIEQRRQNNRVYYYAVHVIKERNGKRRVQKCYLGPSVYEYVTRLHTREGLVFKGLLETNRVIEYLESILQSLINGPVDQETRKRVAEKLRYYAEILERT